MKRPTGAEAPAVERLEGIRVVRRCVEDFRVEHRADIQRCWLRRVVGFRTEIHHPASPATHVLRSVIFGSRKRWSTRSPSPPPSVIGIPLPAEGQTLLQVVFFSIRAQLQVHLRAAGVVFSKGLSRGHKRRGIGPVVGCHGAALRGLEVVHVMGVIRHFELLAQLDDGVRRDRVDLVVEVPLERGLGRAVHALQCRGLVQSPVEARPLVLLVL